MTYPPFIFVAHGISLILTCLSLSLPSSSSFFFLPIVQGLTEPRFHGRLFFSFSFHDGSSPTY